jgi:DHA3 family macrolide efflux protein-like MFS transporter
MASSLAGNRPVRYRDVFSNGTWIRLWTGQTISQLGDFVSDIAFPLLVYELTKSAVSLSFGFAIELLPLIVIGPLAGVFADRWNRRSLLLTVDGVRVLCALGLFFSTSLWQLYLLALVAAIMQAIFLATYSAVIPQITGQQYVKSISLSHSGYRTMQVIGPLVAAGIIGLAHGPRLAFAFDAATFAAGFLLTFTIRVGTVERKEHTRQFFDDLHTGARFLGQSTVVRYLASYNTIVTIASAAAALGTVIYIKTALGLSATASDQLYGLTAALLAGSLALGTWLIGLLDHRLPKRSLLLWGPVLAGLAYLLFLLRPGPIAVLPIYFAVSIGNACSLVPVLAFLATAIPNDLRGRVYSFMNAIDAGAQLAAYGVFAAVGLLLPPGVVLAIAGGVLLIGMPLCAFALKGTRALRQHEYTTLNTRPLVRLAAEWIKPIELCECGYQDNRSEMRFCPHCGKPKRIG